MSRGRLRGWGCCRDEKWRAWIEEGRKGDELGIDVVVRDFGPKFHERAEQLSVAGQLRLDVEPVLSDFV